ncbi:MAG TPA: two-component regulator propeller domain-containing protein, partial [Saprospiraceae bacterium]|nr:two-component regulator propeller domain-containing protein [Saprospiraceae bacterium]
MEDKRVLCYDPANDSIHVFEVPPGTSSSHPESLRDLLIDDTDSLWVILEQSIAVFHEGNNNFQRYGTPHFQPDVVNWSAIRDPSGDLWISTNAGLYKFDRKNVQTSFVSLGFFMGGMAHRGDQLVGGLCWDRKGRLWLGGFNGLYCFNPRTKTTKRYAHAPNNPMSLQSNRIYAVLLDPSNVLWAGSWRGGLSKGDLKKERFGHYRHSEATPFAGGSNDIVGIKEQSHGSFWLTSTNGGLTRMDFESGTYRQYPNDPGNRFKFVPGEITSLTTEPGGNLWISVGDKVAYFDSKKEIFSTLAPPDIQENQRQIQLIYYDRFGFLWMGVHEVGILRYNPRDKKFKLFQFEGDDSSATPITGAWMFFEDREGNLWAGGWGGNSF